MTLNEPGVVKSARRVLQIFEVFAEAGGELSLAQIATRLGIPRSSCLALIRTLSSCGYLYQVGVHHYYPTMLTFQIAESIAANDLRLKMALPVMTALRDQTGETIILGKRQGSRVIYLLVVESNEILRYSARPGDFKPLHGSASGKVLLAALTPEERRRMLELSPPVPITPHTITNVQSLERNLAAGLKRGWQYVESENVTGVIAVAAPVRMAGDVFAMVVAGPDHRVKPKIPKITEALLESCDRLTKAGTPSKQT